MHFSKLNTPCDNCPFRSDKSFSLSQHQRQEIVNSLRTDHPFPCHKTIDYEAWAEHDKYIATDGEHHCAGALIAMKKNGELFDNLAIRIAVWLKWFDEDTLDMDAPVMTLDEFLDVEDL